MSGAKIYPAKLRVKVRGLSRDAAEHAANRVALRARASVLGQGRIYTHEMIRSFRVRELPTFFTRPTFRVYNLAKHFPYQELGTPKEAPGVGFIYPKRGKFLRFQVRGAGPFIYARRVRGVRPGHFLRRAAAATTLKDFTSVF